MKTKIRHFFSNHHYGSSFSQRGGVGGFLLIVLLIGAVLVGLSIWGEPWEWFYSAADDQQMRLAHRTAQSLYDYYDELGRFPWNDTTEGFVAEQTRPESAYVFLAGQGENTMWLNNLVKVVSVPYKDLEILRDGEKLTILKQISSGNRVAVCFLPTSQKYRRLAAENCREDSNGRRIAPYAVAGYDPCAGTSGEIEDSLGQEIANLYCEVVE